MGCNGHQRKQSRAALDLMRRRHKLVQMVDPMAGAAGALAASDAWERIGRVAWSGFGGVLMIEAMKRIYIEPGKPVRGKRVVKVPRKKLAAEPIRKNVKKDVEHV
jgi:hypothetical protein